MINQIFILSIKSLIIQILDDINIEEVLNIQLTKMKEEDYNFINSSNGQYNNQQDIPQTNLLKELMLKLNITEDIEVAELLELLKKIEKSANSVSTESLSIDDGAKLILRRYDE